MANVKEKKHLFLELKNLSADTKEGIEYIMNYFGENTASKAIKALIDLAPVIIKKADEKIKNRTGS